MEKLAAPQILQAILSDNPKYFTLSENRRLDILSNFEITDLYGNKLFEMQLEDMQPAYEHMEAERKKQCSVGNVPSIGNVIGAKIKGIITAWRTNGVVANLLAKLSAKMQRRKGKKYVRN